MGEKNRTRKRKQRGRKSVNHKCGPENENQNAHEKSTDKTTGYGAEKYARTKKNAPERQVRPKRNNNKKQIRTGKKNKI